MSSVLEPPWSYFSWNIGPRFIKSYDWNNEFEPLVETHVPDNLAIAKNNIETCGPQYMWNFAKKIINPYELVYTYKKNNIPKSLSMHVPLSRSYFKMIEMLHVTEYFSKRPSKISLRTAHVCEGPGGFIEAIYELATRYGIKIKDTHAMTLRSSKPHIPGWRRAQQFLHKYKQIKIEYGPDNTGNILIKENRRDFIRSTGKVNIFTADGGFDFTNDYLAQEKHVFPLLIASISIGLSVLAQQGLMIIKIFDYFENSTRQLISFMALLFDKWSIYKPATSRPCNSEQYFIGQGFRGIKEEDLLNLEKLIEFGSMPISIFKSESFNHIYEKIHNQQLQSMTTQINFLNKAQHFVKSWTTSSSEDELKQLWTTVLYNSLYFCKTFKVYHYKINEVKCDFVLPDESSDASDDIFSLDDSVSVVAHSVLTDLKDEIVEGGTSQPNVFQQSLMPDVVSEIPVPSVPTCESYPKVDSDLHPPKSF